MCVSVIVSVFSNMKFCCPAHITIMHRVCTKDIEILVLSLRHYLPQDIHQIRLFVVYITPYADMQAAATIIHELVSQTEAEAPDTNADYRGVQSLRFVRTFTTVPAVCHLSHPKNKACLDHCYGNIQDAYYSKVLPGQGSSDMVTW